MDGAVNHLVVEVRKFIEHLVEKHHLDKYVWAIEFCEETYQSCRQLSKGHSSSSGDEGSPKSQRYWHEPLAVSGPQENLAPLRLHLHACLRFYRQVSLDLRDVMQFMSAGVNVSSSVADRKKKKQIST